MSDFRKRILEPLLLPLAAFVFVGGIAFGLSRMLLATTANGASLLALVASVAVLVACAVVAARGWRTPEKAAALFSFFAIVAGGSVFAATIGIRPVEHHLPEPSFVFTASNSESFDQDVAVVEEAEEIVIRFTNEDPGAPHNWGLQTEEKFAATPSLVDPGAPMPAGESRDYVLEGLEPGAYFYFCFVHPNMKGTMTVGGEGEAPPPAPSAPPSPPASPSAPPSPSPTASPSAAPTGPSTSVEITAVNVQFDTDALTIRANETIEVTFHNNDPSVPHNFAIYNVDLSQKVFDTGVFNGVETKTGSFTSPDPGDYTFRCDVHPNMKGSVVFE